MRTSIIRGIRAAALLAALLACASVAEARKVTAGVDSHGRKFQDTTWQAKGTIFVSRKFADGSPTKRYARAAKGGAVYYTAGHAKGKIWSLSNGVQAERFTAHGQTTRRIYGKQRSFESGTPIAPSIETVTRMWKVGPRGNALGVSRHRTANGTSTVTRVGAKRLPRADLPAAFTGR